MKRIRKLRIRKLLKIVAWALSVAFLVAFLLQSPYLYHRYYLYPRLQSALEAIRQTRREPVRRDDGLMDLRGVMHSHSYLSHDSDGRPPQIAAAARRAGLDFIFMTDHYAGPQNQAAINEGVRGELNGALFVVGVETNVGLMPFFLERTVIDLHKPASEIIADLNRAGALVFIVHPDEPRDWSLPGYTGMEIYNLHADAKRSKLTRWDLLCETWWAMDQYPMLVYHRIFREPTEFLRIWDGLTPNRKVVGIAGNDAHQNNGLRFVVTSRRTVELRDTAKLEKPPLHEISNSLLLWLLRHTSNDFTPGRTLYRIDADLYWRSFQFVNTHLLAKEKSERALYEALRAGHCYVAFDWLCEATGLNFVAESRGGLALMGDDLPFDAGIVLKLTSPVKARFKLLRNGAPVFETESDHFEYAVTEPGVYRVEGHLPVRGELWPWVYANPIYITSRMREGNHR